MILTMALTLASYATDVEQPFEVVSTYAGKSGAECSAGTIYRASDRQEIRFELEKESLVSFVDLRAEATLRHACQLELDYLAFEVDGIVASSEKPYVKLDGSGLTTRSFKLPAETPDRMSAGVHTVALSVSGGATQARDAANVKLGGLIRIWRDRDDDGDLHPDLGGTDCDDTDPQRNGNLPDYKDDIDNDCVDGIDTDLDKDGLVDAHEVDHGCAIDSPDMDEDGFGDAEEWGDDLWTPADSDGDGRYDFDDDDSDDDGVPDIEEERGDTDGDGVPDRIDDDDDGDGLPTKDEAEGDADGDGLDNYLDPDSDNDGVIDGAEGTGDRDGDGLPDVLDAGGDYDMATEPSSPDGAGFGWGCQSAPASVGTWALLLGMLALRRRRGGTLGR